MTVPNRVFDAPVARVRLVEAHLDVAVAVARFTDVIALIGVGLEPVACALDHVQRVPLGDALLDPPRENRGRVDEHVGVEPDGFVCCPQSDVGRLELVLDLCAVVRPAGDAVDLFADDGLEAPVRAGRFSEQIMDATVARNGDSEPFMTVAPATCVEILAT
nr:hypothetical protein [Lentzea aerocolonigenes]